MVQAGRMPVTLTRIADAAADDFDALIDVRAPAEFAEDHLPGAVNLPVLDDAERARVGTIYTQESPFLARRIGAALVARNAARHLDGYLACKGPRFRPLVYCWRGGQRSGSFATILRQVGWRAETIEGGYRSWRRLVKAALYDAPFRAPVVLLDGNTGTAKTQILSALRARGVQVIDLEGLARHRGSLFGEVPGGQPAQKGFETALAARIAALDPARPVLVEAESSKIGAINLPPALWRAMQAAPRIEIGAPRAVRAGYLAAAYGDIVAEPARLGAVIAQLRPFHAAERIADWQALAAAGEVTALAAELITHHYDPRYAKARARDAGTVRARVWATSLDAAGIAAAAERVSAALQRLA